MSNLSPSVHPNEHLVSQQRQELLGNLFPRGVPRLWCPLLTHFRARANWTRRGSMATSAIWQPMFRASLCPAPPARDGRWATTTCAACSRWSGRPHGRPAWRCWWECSNTRRPTCSARSTARWLGSRQRPRRPRPAKAWPGWGWWASPCVLRQAATCPRRNSRPVCARCWIAACPRPSINFRK